MQLMLPLGTCGSTLDFSETNELTTSGEFL
jgi:hypothetical protein